MGHLSPWRSHQGDSITRSWFWPRFRKPVRKRRIFVHSAGATKLCCDHAGRLCRLRRKTCANDTASSELTLYAFRVASKPCIAPEYKRVEFLLRIRAHHCLPFVGSRGDFIETSHAQADALHRHVGFLFTPGHLSHMFPASYRGITAPDRHGRCRSLPGRTVLRHACCRSWFFSCQCRTMKSIWLFAVGSGRGETPTHACYPG